MTSARPVCRIIPADGKLGTVLPGKVRRPVSARSVCTGHIKPSTQKVNQTRIPAVLDGDCREAATLPMSAELVDRVHSCPEFLRIVTTFNWAALVLWLVVQAAAVIRPRVSKHAGPGPRVIR